MKIFKQFIFKPFLIIISWALVFSFIAGTIDFTEWSMWLRVVAIIALFITFIVTDSE